MAGEKHFYIESFETVQLSSYRLGQSPFAHRYVTDQTIFGLYCDRLYPLKSADDEGSDSQVLEVAQWRPAVRRPGAAA